MGGPTASPCGSAAEPASLGQGCRPCRTPPENPDLGPFSNSAPTDFQEVSPNIYRVIENRSREKVGVVTARE